jgi:DNA-directed RNA polymerase subunit L
MKARVLKRADNELKLELDDVGHTLCNLLQEKILEDKSVEMAGYDIPHPLGSSAIIYVRVKGKAKPDEVLKEAVERARESNKEFAEELKRALKEK